VTPAPFPWRRAMAVGFGALRLSPESFWRMTPRELAAAIEGALGDMSNDASASLARDAFEALRARFPDRPAAPRASSQTKRLHG
jgi:uncharacterized phage protein (TIGR02216 family)